MFIKTKYGIVHASIACPKCDHVGYDPYKKGEDGGFHMRCFVCGHEGYETKDSCEKRENGLNEMMERMKKERENADVEYGNTARSIRLRYRATLRDVSIHSGIDVGRICKAEQGIIKFTAEERRLYIRACIRQGRCGKWKKES